MVMATSLVIFASRSQFSGLFGEVRAATISNLGLDAVMSMEQEGVLAHRGLKHLGSITASYSTGTVTGNECVATRGIQLWPHYGLLSTGTVTGRVLSAARGSNGGDITASYSTGAVIGVEYVGASWEVMA